MLKRLILVSAIALATLPLGHSTRVLAQQQVILCQAPDVPCSLSGPMNTQTGDPSWLFNGRSNWNFGQLYGMFGPTSHLFATGSANASDIVGLFSSCSGTDYLGADGACHTGGGGGGSGTVTSVALAAPTGFTVTGSPVTTNGTLGLNFTVSGLLNGTGTGITSATSAEVISLWSGTCNATTYLRADGTCQPASGGSGGTVTSVGLADGSSTPIYTITNSPITNAGSLTFTLKTEPANSIMAGPTTGSPAQPTFRALVSADIPTALPNLASASSLATVGTIGSGTWQGTAIGAGYGGTGSAGLLNGLVVANGASAFSDATYPNVTALWSGTCNASTFLRGDGSCQAPAGSGTVTSVGLSAPSVFSVTGTPVTGAGTLALSFAGGQAQNEFLGTPNGASGAVGLRAIVSADLPGTIASNTSGNAATATALATTPAQCSGGQYATGITASGNANCNTPSGAVTSFSGDGALISNSGSTGAVTATLANTGVGYGVFGNIASSSGAPGYHALSSYPTAAFPTLNQNTTGTAANVTATSNSTLTTLSALISANSSTIPASTTLAGLSITETWTAPQTFTNSDFLLLGSSTGKTTFTSANASATNYTVTFPAATDTVVELTQTQTITNKTISGSSNTLTNIPAANLTGTASVNTTGTAAGLSGTPALPNGTTATTQTTGDNTTKIATDAFVLANSSSSGVASAAAGPGISITGTGSGPYTGAITVSSTAPERTVTSSPTVASTDMGGQIIANVSGGGTLTIPAISGSVFANGMTLSVVNYSASTMAVSTTPTVNAGGGCVSGTGIPSGDTWQILSNGTTLDCFQTISTGGGGSGTVTTTGSPGSGNLAEFSGSTSITNGNLSGDCTTSGTLAVTCTKTSGTAFGALATVTPGTGVATALAANVGAAGAFVTNLANGTQALGTSAIASGTCATTITVAISGATTSDTAAITSMTDPNTVTGYKASATGALYVNAFMTSGDLNIEVCNNTQASITPGAMNVHYSVTSP